MLQAVMVATTNSKLLPNMSPASSAMSVVVMSPTRESKMMVSRMGAMAKGTR